MLHQRPAACLSSAEGRRGVHTVRPTPAIFTACRNPASHVDGVNSAELLTCPRIGDPCALKQALTVLSTDSADMVDQRDMGIDLCQHGLLPHDGIGSHYAEREACGSPIG